MFEEEIKLDLEIEQDLYKAEEENKGEDATSLFDTCLLLDNAEEKGEKVIKYCKFLQWQNEYIDAEKKRLDEQKKRNEKKLDKAKQYLLVLNKMGIKSFNTYHTFIKNTVAVEVNKDVDVDKISEDFLNIKTVKEISKTKIKEYLSKSIIDNDTGEIIGNQLDWARLVNNENIVIK